MIDHNTLPYIDLGASTEVLREYAKEHFGKVIHPSAKPETVVDRFASIYFEETGVELAPVEQPAGDGDGDPKEDEPERKPIAATILVHDDEKDPSPICGSVQYQAYRIKRNTNVRVSMPILETLKNAKKTVYDPETMVAKEVAVYPFSIVQYHYE